MVGCSIKYRKFVRVCVLGVLWYVPCRATPRACLIRATWIYICLSISSLMGHSHVININWRSRTTTHTHTLAACTGTVDWFPFCGYRCRVDTTVLCDKFIWLSLQKSTFNKIHFVCVCASEGVFSSGKIFLFIWSRETRIETIRNLLMTTVNKYTPNDKNRNSRTDLTMPCIDERLICFPEIVRQFIYSICSIYCHSPSGAATTKMYQFMIYINLLMSSFDLLCCDVLLWRFFASFQFCRRFNICFINKRRHAWA